ncbi:MAG TPA: hypothetical protein GX747_04335, partial [Tenericutes bacterium]|nr:hypothetical protein [Mycoplasmatota bacterium]
NINNNFEDIVADIVGREANKEKLTIYLFYGDGCPHCAEEETFLKKLEKKYKENIEIVKYEVWKNEANSSFLKQVKNKFMSTSTGVPFTVIGKNYYVGYSDTVGSQIENNIKEYLSSIGEDIDLSNKIKLPFLGYVDGKKVSLPLVGVVLGVIDGFNPCAMRVLLFIINMLFGMENRKRMWILGVSFLLTSGFIYFLAMLGISSALSVASIIWIRKLIGVVALIGGLLNLKNYLKTKNDGCHVVDEKKRKSMFKKIRKFTTEKSFILALIGVITLAVSVNLVELACSLGFPAIYSSLLGINNIVGLEKIIYLLIYTLFYLIDDLVIFVIAMSTLRLTGISTKYNKYSHLIGGTIMFIIGLLLIFKPEWLMFNFN